VAQTVRQVHSSWNGEEDGQVPPEDQAILEAATRREQKRKNASSRLQKKVVPEEEVESTSQDPIDEQTDRDQWTKLIGDTLSIATESLDTLENVRDDLMEAYRAKEQAIEKLRQAEAIRAQAAKFRLARKARSQQRKQRKRRARAQPRAPLLPPNITVWQHDNTPTGSRNHTNFQSGL
jgi:hypothetical protein